MAVPVLGGLLISDEVVDIFLPVRFYWVRRVRWLKLQEERAAAGRAATGAATPEAAPEPDDRSTWIVAMPYGPSGADGAAVAAPRAGDSPLSP
jgi:hypothetical protein